MAGLTVSQTLVDGPVLLPLHLPHHQHGHGGLEPALLAEDTGGGVEGDALPGPGQDRQRVAWQWKCKKGRSIDCPCFILLPIKLY